MAEKSTRVFASQGESISRTIDIYLEADGSLKVEGGDVGKGVEEFWGDSDYEFWTKIAPDDVPALCFALLRDKLSGDRNAVETAQDYCKAEGIKADFGTWI